MNMIETQLNSQNRNFIRRVRKSLKEADLSKKTLNHLHNMINTLRKTKSTKNQEGEQT